MTFVPPTLARLHERLSYDAETGRLRWRACESMPSAWNSRWAGAEALATENGNGYRRGRFDGVNLYAHQVVWAFEHGVWPEHEIDHDDRNRSNNRPGNLKASDRLSNSKNASRSSANTSGVTGVCWKPKKSKWHAQIGVRNKNYHLGFFENKADAVAARLKAEADHGFHPNHGK